MSMRRPTINPTQYDIAEVFKSIYPKLPIEIMNHDRRDRHSPVLFFDLVYVRPKGAVVKEYRKTCVLNRKEISEGVEFFLMPTNPETVLNWYNPQSAGVDNINPHIPHTGRVSVRLDESQPEYRINFFPKNTFLQEQSARQKFVFPRRKLHEIMNESLL